VSYGSINDVLDIALQPPSKVLEPGGITGENDILLGALPSAQGHTTRTTTFVQTPPDIDRTRLNDIDYNLGQGRQEV
jgi:hypothetical protein